MWITPCILRRSFHHLVTVAFNTMNSVHDRHKRLAGRDLVAFADLAEFAVTHDALHHHDAIHRRLHGHLLDIGFRPRHFDLGLIAVQLRGANLGALRFFHQGGFRKQLLVVGLVFFYREFVFFSVDRGTHFGRLQVEHGLVPIGLCGANLLIVGFLHSGEIGHHLLDHVLLLDRRIFVVVEPLQLVLGVEFGHGVT